jgi:hypothetical protein
MQIKVSELKERALDWAVAKCEGLAVSDRATKWRNENCPHLYSTNWAQGGPIIEREGINLAFQGDAHDWIASAWDYTAQDWSLYTEGPTPLIAAMRCYVVSRLGDTVEIPDELAKG